VRISTSRGLREKLWHADAIAATRLDEDLVATIDHGNTHAARVPNCIQRRPHCLVVRVVSRFVGHASSIQFTLRITTHASGGSAPHADASAWGECADGPN